MCNRPYLTKQKIIYTPVVLSLFEDAIKKAMLWHEAHSIAFLLFYDVFRISFSLLDSIQNGFQSADEVIHVLLGKAERWKQTQQVGAGAAGEAVLVIDEWLAHVSLRDIKLHTYHQSATTHVGDVLAFW